MSVVPISFREALLLLLLSTACAGPVGAQQVQRPAWIDGFDAEVRRVMDDWQVPGLAIGIVTDRAVVWTKGFGTRDRETGAPVTPRTLFAIGSSTKAFTAASLGVLRDDGRLSGSAPVEQYVPRFGLNDPLASRRATAIDLLTHRTGLPGHELLWEATTHSRGDLVGRLRHLQLSAPFRTETQYNNLMYAAAGYLAGQVHGTSWETLVRNRLFAPLGMGRSTFSVDTMQAGRDFARPYDLEADSVVAVEARRLGAIGPAGSIHSSVSDLTAWLQLFLRDGRYGDKRILESETVEELLRPRVVWSDYPIQVKPTPHTAYALGWFVQPYRGNRLVQHGGNIDGYSALLGFLPEEDLGWVILTNRDGGTPATHALMYSIIDRRLGRDGPDWNQRLLDRYGSPRESSSEENRDQDVKRSTPPRSLTEYVGTYEHPGYGTVRVTRTGNRLVGHYGTVRDTLRHRESNTFQMELAVGRDTYYRQLTFRSDSAGTVTSVSIPMEPAVDPTVFSRLRDEKRSPENGDDS